MVKSENYPNAYKEVYEILKKVPQKDLIKIPKRFIEMIEKNMNKNYEFSIDDNKDFLEEQELMTETKIVLGYIFLNYWATEEQSKNIKQKLRNDIEKEEIRNTYDTKKHDEKPKITQISVTEYKKENFLIEIIKKIKEKLNKIKELLK